MLLLFTLLSTLTLTLTYAQGLPPAGEVGIPSVSIEGNTVGALASGMPGAPEALAATGGSGCKANSVSTNFNGDRTVLTLIFNEFIANLGPDIPAQQNRRFCSVNLKMKVPKGWTFHVNTVDWRGYVDLDKGVRGTLGSSYFWSARRDEKTNIHKQIEGPIHGSYLKHRDGEKDKAVWLPCTTTENTLNINTAVRLSKSGNQNNDKAKGSITVDSVDAKFKQVLNLEWKKC